MYNMFKHLAQTGIVCRPACCRQMIIRWIFKQRMSHNQFNYLYKFFLRHKGKNLKTLAWLVKSIDILPFEAKYTYYWFPRNRIDTNKLPNMFSFSTVQLHLRLLIVMTKNRWHSSLCTASSRKKWRGPLSNFILEESGRLYTGYDIHSPFKHLCSCSFELGVNQLLLAKN